MASPLKNIMGRSEVAYGGITVMTLLRFIAPTIRVILTVLGRPRTDVATGLRTKLYDVDDFQIISTNPSDDMSLRNPAVTGMLYFAAISDRIYAVSMIADDPQYDKLTDIVRSWRVKMTVSEPELTVSWVDEHTEKIYKARLRSLVSVQSLARRCFGHKEDEAYMQKADDVWHAFAVLFAGMVLYLVVGSIIVWGMGAVILLGLAVYVVVLSLIFLKHIFY